MSTLPDCPANHPADDPVAPSAALGELAKRIEQFLAAQIDRLEKALARLPQAGRPPATLASAHLDPQELSNLEDPSLEEKLRQDAAYLMEAWDRLEAAQRELRIQQQVLQTAGGGAAMRTASEPARPAARSTARVLVATAAPTAPTGYETMDEELDDQFDVSEFRQLHLEVQNHIRRECR